MYGTWHIAHRQDDLGISENLPSIRGTIHPLTIQYLREEPSIRGIFGDFGGSINGVSPIAGWFIMENPIKRDEQWGTPILGNHHL